MSPPSNCRDYVAMESFFSERTAAKVYRTRDRARANVFDHIEWFYSDVRWHRPWGYLSAIEFEMKSGLA